MDTAHSSNWESPATGPGGADQESGLVSRPLPEMESTRRRAVFRVAKYLLVRIISIAITIFIGLLITAIIANRTSQLDASARQEAHAEMLKNLPPGICNYWYCEETPEAQAILAEYTSKYEAAAGLHLPFLPRHMLWAVRALRLDLGRDLFYRGTSGSFYSSAGAGKAILADFPHTLILVGPAFCLLFLLGIPLALRLFRIQGGFLDRFFALLAPISSVPSWVLSVILILLFAVGIHLLPPAGMYGTVPPSTSVERFLQILQHMILTVLAIFLSLFFQCLYTWKTFFLLHANEDYVELARAKGLPNSRLEKLYILRPTLPVILTNFAFLLVGFWQMTMVLEVVFNWPGIGRMYIDSLPNFLGEQMDPGNMPIVVNIVALFAYILGFTVLVLDILYAILDPRIRLGSDGQTVRPAVGKVWKGHRRRSRFEPPPLPRPVSVSPPLQVEPAKPLQPLARPPISRRNGASPLISALREVRRYPTAIAGLTIILLLVIGSIVAVTAFPYQRLGNLWSSNALTGKSYVPKLAAPMWVNWLRKTPLPSTTILNSVDGTAQKTVQPPGADGVGHTTLTYSLDYRSGDYPQDLIVYFSSHYASKRPFAVLHWLTPDGRDLELTNLSPETGLPLYLSRDLSPYRILVDYPAWQKWFVAEEGYQATPHYYLLFSDPAKDRPTILPGTYTLRIDITTFEPAASVDAELVLLGKVWGWAGTDYLRRDLLVPLLWGMPFALALGLIGATVTTVLSMIIAAAGVWFGGGLDDLVQRLIEGIMILPVVAIGVLFYAFYNMNIWTFLALIALLNVFGSPAKSFRAAFLQIKDAPYVEWAKASGASNLRIIMQYLVPGILPALIPQLVALIPTYVFLEATLGIFGIKSIYPTWGKVIYEAIRNGALYGSGYWVLEPISLLLLTGLAFAMLGFALERILNPRLKSE